MNNAKEIAEKIIYCNDDDVNYRHRVELARAYLELEKKLQFTNNNWPHENKLHEEITKLKEENEKLKKSREVLRKAVEFYSDKNKWNGYGKYNTEMMFESDHEITNEIYYISNCDCESCCNCEPLDSGEKYVVAGKKAREAIKADDEIMKGE